MRSVPLPRRRAYQCAAATAACAGLAAPLLADENDRKLRDDKPAIIGSIWRYADP